MSTPDTVAEVAKCEGLEKVVIGDTSEKLFQVGAQLSSGEGRVDRISQKKY